MLKPDLINRISAGYAAFLQPARTPDFLIPLDAQIAMYYARGLMEWILPAVIQAHGSLISV